MTTEKTSDDVPAPDGKDDAVLRWGRYVIEHLQPSEGDVLLVKGPARPGAAEKREKMADALEQAYEDAGIEDFTLIIGPTHHANVHQISDDQMRKLGYVPKERARTPEQ